MEEDLKRRDFTINAMAIDHNFELIDLYKGMDDLNNKLIRAVGNPKERFEEDALRMLRAVRIASQLGFTVESTTLKAIQDNASSIKKISAERIHDELLKMFGSPYPADGYLLLHNSGLGQELLPEMEATFGVEQKAQGDTIFSMWELTVSNHCEIVIQKIPLHALRHLFTM